jgi:hypothetical protein
MSQYPPVYSALSRRAAVLQRLQLLSDEPRTVTLSEIMAELEAMQREFGATSSLEAIIQREAGAQLAAQRAARLLGKAVMV